MPEKPHNSIQKLLVLLESMLTPLVRFSLKRGIPLSDFIEVLKRAYVRCAEVELSTHNPKPSASRIAAITGVHRKDIVRFSIQQSPRDPDQSVISRVMTHWKHDRRFSKRGGIAKKLTTEGHASEFAQLVAAVIGRDISFYAILHEMERLNIVRREAGLAELMWRDFVPHPKLEEAITMYAHDMDNLLAAIEENVEASTETPNLHLRTIFDNVVAEALPEIRVWLLNEGSLFQKRVAEYIAQFDKDLEPNLKHKAGGSRIVCASFTRVVEAPHASSLMQSKAAIESTRPKRRSVKVR